MVNYRCDYCGVFFDAPVIVKHREHLGEGIYRVDTEAMCPICGCNSFQYASTCPQCERPMIDSGHLLCDKCRSFLKERFTAFADTLTAEEEAQLDQWLDGDTIDNRRNWT